MIFIIWITFSLKNIDIRSDIIQRDWVAYVNNTEALEGHFYLLLITYYLLLITYYLLLITYYLLLITYYLLLITYHIIYPPITAGNSQYTFPVTAVAVVVIVVVVVVAVYL